MRVEDERATVHNLTVERTHTYYAGGVWVHNTCPPSKDAVLDLTETTKAVDHKTAVEEIQSRGGNVVVRSQAEAEELVRQAFPQLNRTSTYSNMPPGGSWQVHPPEGALHPMSHVKYRLAKGEVKGRIFFPGSPRW